jgi:hypothetical protein
MAEWAVEIVSKCEDLLREFSFQARKDVVEGKGVS